MMYKRDFDNQFNSNKEFSAYMFFGQSEYLIENYAKKVALSLTSSDEIEKIYFDDYDFKYAKDKLLQSSLFASKNVLLIKTSKKLPKTEVVALIEACNTNKDSTVIFACLGDSDFKTMGGYFTPKNNSASVRFFAPFPNEAIKILENEAKNLGMGYDVSALNHLYFMHRSDLSLCVNDLKKLSILNEESISPKLVELHCFGIGAVGMEDFLYNFFSGGNIKRDLFFLLEEGANEVQLLNQISSYLHQLFLIRAYATTIGKPDPKQILGFAPPMPIWQKKCDLAVKKINLDKFLDVFQFLGNLELELKSGKIPDSNAYFQASLRKLSDKLR